MRRLSFVVRCAALFVLAFTQMGGCGSDKTKTVVVSPPVDPEQVLFTVDNFDATPYVLIVTTYDPGTETVPVVWPWFTSPFYQVVCTVFSNATCEGAITLLDSNPTRAHLLQLIDGGTGVETDFYVIVKGSTDMDFLVEIAGGFMNVTEW